MTPPDQLIIFSPLPPKQNGIATYVAEQLPLLSRHFQCTVVIEDNHPQPSDTPNNVSILFLTQYLHQETDYSALPHLFHVGNNLDSLYMLDVLIRSNGIVVIHDLNLHHLISEQTLGRGAPKAYSNYLFQEYGKLGLTLGQQFEAHGLKGETLTTELAFNEWIARAADHIIVHSEYSANKLGALFGTRESITVIPHHISPAASKFQAKLKDEYRRELKLGASTPIFASLGFIAKAKQIPAALETCKKLKDADVDFHYVLAGASKPWEYDVDADIARLGLQEHVTITGFVNEDLFFKYLHACDFILNLRYPTGGESSGTMTRALAAGQCTVIINDGPIAEVPDACAVKINWSETFADDLFDQLLSLISDSTLAKGVGLNAAKWASKSQQIGSCISEYVKVVRANTNRASLPGHQIWRRYSTKEAIENYKAKCPNERMAPGKDIAIHWWNEGLVPLWDPNDKNCLLIAPSRAPISVMNELMGYSDSRIDFCNNGDFLSSISPENFRRYSNVIALLPAEIFLGDPVAVLSKLNFICSLGGHLVIGALWDEWKEPRVPFMPEDFHQYCLAAGISVHKTVVEVSEASLAGDFDYPYQEEWYIQGEVTSGVIDRFPRHQYPGSYSVAERLHPLYFSELEERSKFRKNLLQPPKLAPEATEKDNWRRSHSPITTEVDNAHDPC